MGLRKESREAVFQSIIAASANSYIPAVKKERQRKTEREREIKKDLDAWVENLEKQMSSRHENQFGLMAERELER
jgi:hypothetical protein